MKIGMVGLGRMGSNMARRLLGAGHECVVFDIHPQAADELVKAGAVPALSLADLAAGLEAPRAIWIMVPAAAVDATLEPLAPLLAADSSSTSCPTTGRQPLRIVARRLICVGRRRCTPTRRWAHR